MHKLPCSPLLGMFHEIEHLISVFPLQACVGIAPLVTLVSDDLHAHQTRDTHCQPFLNRTATCSRLRVRK